MDRSIETTESAATGAIERTLELKAPIDRVWAALVEKEQLDRWWGGGSAGSFELGSQGWFEWEGMGRFAYRVEAFQPPAHVAYRWAREPDTDLDEAETTLVEFTLAPMSNGGTRLELRESGFSHPSHRAQNLEGWYEELGNLSKVVGG